MRNNISDNVVLRKKACELLFELLKLLESSQMMDDLIDGSSEEYEELFEELHDWQQLVIESSRRM